MYELQSKSCSLVEQTWLPHSNKTLFLTSWFLRAQTQILPCLLRAELDLTSDACQTKLMKTAVPSVDSPTCKHIVYLAK